MPNVKLTDLTAQPSTDVATDDVMYIVDVSEVLAADQSKKITVAEIGAGLIESATAMPSTNIATGDSIFIYDASAAALQKITLANLFVWQNYTATVTYGGGTTDPTTTSVTSAKYCQVGSMVCGYVKVSITRGSGDRTIVNISAPITASENFVPFSAVQSMTSANLLAASGYMSSATNLRVLLGGAMTADGNVNIAFTYPAA